MLDYAWKSDVKHILTLRAQVEADELKEKQQVQQKRLMEKLAAEEYERRYQERKLQRQEYLTEQKRNRVLAEREKAHQERLKAEEIREKQRKRPRFSGKNVFPYLSMRVSLISPPAPGFEPSC